VGSVVAFSPRTFLKRHSHSLLSLSAEAETSKEQKPKAPAKKWSKDTKEGAKGTAKGDDQRASVESISLPAPLAFAL